MFCTQCGTQLPENAKFCSSCGTNLIPLKEGKSGTDRKKSGTDRKKSGNDEKKSDLPTFFLVCIGFFCLWLIFKPGPLGISIYDAATLGFEESKNEAILLAIIGSFSFLFALSRHNSIHKRQNKKRVGGCSVEGCRRSAIYNQSYCYVCKEKLTKKQSKDSEKASENKTRAKKRS